MINDEINVEVILLVILILVNIARDDEMLMSNNFLFFVMQSYLTSSD